LFEVRKCATEKYATPSEAYSAEAVKDSSAFEWHKCFEGDSEKVEGSERSGLPKKANIRIRAFSTFVLEKCGIFFVLRRLNDQPGLLGRNIDEFT
jgi:hypothetical protein